MVTLSPRDRAELAMDVARNVVDLLAAKEGKPALLDAHGLAKALGVSTSTLERWVSQGRVPVKLRVGNVRRFSLTEALDALSGEHPK